MKSMHSRQTRDVKLPYLNAYIRRNASTRYILKLAHRYKDIHTKDIHNPRHAYTLVPKKQIDPILDDSSTIFCLF